MEELLAELEQAFADYRTEVEACEKKSKPMDGLFGLGHSVKDDACHGRFDDRVSKAVGAICAAQPAPDDAASALRVLLARRDAETWPPSAQWMLRAAERHGLPLIPSLSAGDADALFKAYADRYKPWDRLPVQRKVFRALKEAANRRGGR